MSFFHRRTESLFRRMSVAKSLGLLLGLLAGFVYAPLYLGVGLTLPLQWGFLLWGLMFGSVIGIAGVITGCPVWKNCPLYASNSWRPILRGGVIGAFLEVVLALLLYNMFQDMLSVSFAGTFIATWNPVFAGAIEGFILGAFIDWVATRAGGEGKKIL